MKVGARGQQTQNAPLVRIPSMNLIQKCTVKDEISRHDLIQHIESALVDGLVKQPEDDRFVEIRRHIYLWLRSVCCYKQLCERDVGTRAAPTALTLNPAIAGPGPPRTRTNQSPRPRACCGPYPSCRRATGCCRAQNHVLRHRLW